MFIAELSDPAHGEAEATGETEQAAVEAAFRKLYSWPDATFEGYVDERGRVWLESWGKEFLLGTVDPVEVEG